MEEVGGRLGQVEEQVESKSAQLEEVTSEFLKEQLRAVELQKKVEEAETSVAKTNLELKSCKSTLTESKEAGQGLKCSSPCTISKMASNVHVSLIISQLSLNF